MTRKDIDHLAWQYRKQALVIVGTLFLAGLLAANVTVHSELLIPLYFSAVYALVIEMCEAVVWNKVAKNSPDAMPNFLMGVSVVRTLSALALMFVYYLVGQKELIMVFLGVFAVFYIAILVHHITFFRRHSGISIDE